MRLLLSIRGFEANTEGSSQIINASGIFIKSNVRIFYNLYKLSGKVDDNGLFKSYLYFALLLLTKKYYFQKLHV